MGICINGGLAGMVALCAGCNVLHQGAAFALGIMGGFTCYWTASLASSLGVDDPLDAFAVHYGGGVVGVLATPVFMNGGIVDWVNCKDQEAVWDVATMGEFECSYTEFQVWAWNFIGLIAITLWSGGLTALLFYLLNLAGFLRVELDIEVRGLDIKKHGEPAYPTAAYGHGWDSEGDFAMANMQSGGTGAAGAGRRDVKALANPNDPDAWHNGVSDKGLIAMA